MFIMQITNHKSHNSSLKKEISREEVSVKKKCKKRFACQIRCMWDSGVFSCC